MQVSRRFFSVAAVTTRQSCGGIRQSLVIEISRYNQCDGGDASLHLLS